MEQKPSKVKAVLFAVVVTIVFELILTFVQSIYLLPEMMRIIFEEGTADSAGLMEALGEKEGLLATSQFAAEIVLIVAMGAWYYFGYIKKEKIAGTYEPVTKKLSNGNNLAFIICGCVAASSLVFGLYYLLDALIPSQVDQFAEAMSSLADNWMGMVAIMIGAPISEELAIRGIISKKTKLAFNVVGCMIISAVCFSFLHANLIQAIYTLPLGLFYGFLAYKFNSVVPSILCHIFHNSLAGYIEEAIGAPGMLVLLVISCIGVFYFGKRADVLKKEENKEEVVEEVDTTFEA